MTVHYPACTCGHDELDHASHGLRVCWIAVEWNRCTCTGYTPAQAAQDRPGRDETPAAGATDGSAAPDASQGRTCDHHADALDAIATARQLAGADAGTVEALTAIAHAILATHQEQPR